MTKKVLIEKEFKGGLRGFTPIVDVTDISKTLSLDDNLTIQACNNASSQTITIPNDSSVAFINKATEFQILKDGDGDVIIQGAAGVFINGVEQNIITMTSKYQGVFIRKDSNNSYKAYGGFQ